MDPKVKNFLKNVLIRSGPLPRFILDKNFRDYMIVKAPKLAPVLARAAVTKGESLAENPEDLKAVLEFVINDPGVPNSLNKWGVD